MKRLIRTGEAIPRPQALAADSRVPVDNRGELGKRLLAAWRHDGRIRGVSPEGKVFDQTVDARLSQRFLAKLSIEKIRG
jgi:hypothetical protein